MVDIVGRSTWGFRWTSSPGAAPTSRQGLVVHHTVTPEWTGNAGMKQLNELMIRMGFNCVGYTLAIDVNGRVYSGRPLNVVGGHTRGHNTTRHGVALIGNFSHKRPPQPMEQALVDLYRHGIDQGWWAARLTGHRDHGSTACPGAAAYARLGHYRSGNATRDPVEDIMATLDDDDIRNIAEATADRVWAEIIGHGADMRASTLLSRLQGGGIDDVLDAVGRIPARTAGRIAADLPDGSDVVWTADNDVDEGIAMAAAQASGGTYRRWGGGTIDAGHVAAVGRVGDVADVGSGEVTVLQGADRGETAGLAVGFASRLLAES